MRAILISGSARQNSHTKALLDAVAVELSKSSHDCMVWDLADKPLLPFEVEFHNDQSLVVDQNGRSFLDALNQADIVVIGTALYHGSYSGILKNALDYLIKDQLSDKPVGLVCNGGGNAKTTQAIGGLVTITQTLYGIPMQTQIGTSGDDYDETDSGPVLSNPDILQRVKRLSDELIRFAEMLNSAK